MNKKCLYCYGELEATHETEYHPGCSQKIFGTSTPPLLNYSFAEMNQLAKVVVSHHIAVPGVQPKLSLTLIDEVLNKMNRKRLTVVGALGGNYIFKPPSTYYPEMPENEHATMKIAEAFGIKTVPHSLIRLNSGELSYITRRVDRRGDGNKIHMLDMYQITEAVDKYKSSMEKIGKAIAAYSSDTLFDQLRYFELTIFSFLTGNNDMHLKNFSMIQDGSKWILAPAYDLLNVNLANPLDSEEFALTIEGKKKRFTKGHFERFGAQLQLNKKQIEGVFIRFLEKKSLAKSILKNSFLTKESQEKFWSIMEARYSTLAK